MSFVIFTCFRRTHLSPKAIKAFAVFYAFSLKKIKIKDFSQFEKKKKRILKLKPFLNKQNNDPFHLAVQLMGNNGECSLNILPSFSLMIHSKVPLGLFGFDGSHA